MNIMSMGFSTEECLSCGHERAIHLKDGCHMLVALGRCQCTSFHITKVDGHVMTGNNVHEQKDIRLHKIKHNLMDDY